MWHEARRSERKVHDMMDAARKRAQRRAIFLAKRRGDPQQSIQLIGSRCRIYRDDALYHATQDQQGLFDGRALLDFIREPRTRNFRNLENFYLSTVTDEEGLQHVNLEMEAKVLTPFQSDRSQPAQPANKSSYSQVGFSYDAKEEEKRQKEVIKGDPAIRKLSRKERRKASQIEREREREAARITGTRVLRTDPYRESRRSPTYDAYPRRRSRSRSRSYSPSYSRRHARGGYSDDSHRRKPKAPKIEYITEFGGSGDGNGPKLDGVSPPSSPPSQADILNRASSGHILEALHGDPASGVSLDKEKSEVLKPALSGTSALAKLTKASASGGPSKQGQVEKKETPQERLKRIMSKQLNKQIKKDTSAEMAKKREQERQRLEKLEETSRLSRQRYRSRSRSRSNSRSPPRRHRRSRSSSRSRSQRYGKKPFKEIQSNTFTRQRTKYIGLGSPGKRIDFPNEWNFITRDNPGGRSSIPVDQI
ncbi:hypothetical protein GOBAR_DD11028 [Gossypium barbadense]|nr:hypothetical protein GOBAR_DD11028 [Gossypium barbadense]